MKELYISVSVTDYGNGDIRCVLDQCVNGVWMETCKLDKYHALKLIWELVLAGGHRDYGTNWYDRSIHSVSAYLFMPI